MGLDLSTRARIHDYLISVWSLKLCLVVLDNGLTASRSSFAPPAHGTPFHLLKLSFPPLGQTRSQAQLHLAPVSRSSYLGSPTPVAQLGRGCHNERCLQLISAVELASALSPPTSVRTWGSFLLVPAPHGIGVWVRSSTPPPLFPPVSPPYRWDHIYRLHNLSPRVWHAVVGSILVIVMPWYAGASRTGASHTGW